jgi:hypothetical protein
MALDLEIHFHYLHRIKNRWSAVSCPLLGFKVQKEFPSELRTAWFCTVACLLLLRILFISLDLQIEVLFNGRFQGQAGPPQVMFQDIDAKLNCATPRMEWVSGCPGPLSAIFGYR